MASEERVAVVKPANFGKSQKDTAEYLEHRINSTDNKLNQVIDNQASNQAKTDAHFAKIDARFAELGRLFERQSVGQGQKQPVMSNNDDDDDEVDTTRPVTRSRSYQPTTQTPNFTTMFSMSDPRYGTEYAKAKPTGLRDPPCPETNLEDREDRDERRRRERTADTEPSTRSQLTNNSILRVGEMKIKRDDIGTFDPHYDDPHDLGVVTDGKSVIFTDVYCFHERVETFLDSEDTRDGHTRQILELFQTLLGGPAILWWNNEITSQQRRNLRSRGLKDMFEALIRRFSPDPAIATLNFNARVLTLRDIARDEHSLLQFIQTKLRYAKAMGTLTPDNVNWHGTMIQIWSHMDLDIRHYLRPPSRHETLTDYMLQAEQSMSMLLTSAIDRHPYEMRHNKSVKFAVKPFDPSRSVRHFSRSDSNRRPDRRDRDDHGNERDRDRRDNRDRRRDNDRHRHQSRDRKDDTREDKDRGEERDRNDRRRERDGRERRVHWKDVPKRTYVVDSGSDADKANESASNESDDNSSSASEACNVVTETTDSLRRTCNRCQKIFETRNKMFRHVYGNKDHDVPGCQATPPPPKIDPVNLIDVDLDNVEIIEEKPPKPTSAQRGSFTNMKMKIRSTDKSVKDLFEICVDTGTGKDMIDKRFLQKFDHRFIKDVGGFIKGFNGPSTYIDKLAEFSFYVPTSDQTKMVKMYAQAWVVDKLDANCLLGTAWLEPRGAKVDLADRTITFPELNATVSVEICKPTRQVSRKVVATQTVTIQPGESLLMPVSYIPLPKGRSFMLSTTHPALTNAWWTARPRWWPWR
jgi:hypothetical protein